MRLIHGIVGAAAVLVIVSILGGLALMMLAARSVDRTEAADEIALARRTVSRTLDRMVVTGGKGAMPGFVGILSNAQMAEAITYVRTHFGNNYAKPVTEADVAKIAKPPSAGGH